MDLEQRCKNHSFANVRCLPRVDRNGFEIALVVAKLTYVVDAIGNAALVPSQHYLEDVSDGHGGVRYPSDYAEEKPGTDIGVVGTAMPARDNAARANATQQLVWLQVGGLRKAATVFGARSYIAKGGGIAPGPADPFRALPLVHAYAFGGTDLLSKRPHPENPVGRGFAEQPLSLVGQPAHRIEAVPNPVGLGPEIHPAHAGFAPIRDWWEPRRSRSGTHDAKWAHERAPVHPEDFDPRHNAWAVPDLHVDAPLSPDVAIEVGGMTPEGVWRFRLPAYAVAFALGVGDQTKELATHLDALLIDTDRRQIELSFRAAVRLPKKWERLERITIYGVGELPESVFEPPADLGNAATLATKTPISAMGAQP